MSKNDPRILWIDDDKEREKDAKSLGSEFINYHEKIFEQLSATLRERNPDLILIDHKLDIPSTCLPRRGSSIAEYIREERKDCPIVGFSVDRDYCKPLQYETQSTYDDSFELRYIQKHGNEIKSLAGDFSTLRRKVANIGSLRDITSFLKARAVDRDSLERTLPNAVLEGVNAGKRINALVLAKWIRKLVMSTPGFLYGSLDAATHVGLVEACFLREEIQDKFKSALYAGLFWKSSPQKLWWASRLRELAFRMSRSEETLSWKAGHDIDGVKKTDKSKCFNCKKLYPEIVGFTELSGNERKPMHLSCSMTHPFRKAPRFFDEPRIVTQNEL